MMIRLITFFGIVLFVFQCQASDKVSKDDIKKELSKVFSVRVYEYNGEKNPYLTVDTLKTNHFLYSFVNDNNLMLDYFLQNQLKINYDSLYKLAAEPKLLEEYFYKSLYLNNEFEDNVVMLADNYLHKDDKDRIIERKDSSDISAIAQLAVRFFYPITINENNEVVTKICVGINGLKDYGGARDYIKEAFAFLVIFDQLKADNMEIYNEYIKTLNDVKMMNLSSDKDTRLKRIQGAVWAVLSNNETLRKAIRQEYDKMKSYLPFYIN